MPRYAEERKEAVIARLSPPENRSPQEVADMEGISLATVYNWRRQAREQGRCLPDADVTGPEGWTARDKFAAVVEAAALNEHDLAAYCRRRGLHAEQLQAWRRDCEQAADLGNARRGEQAAGDRAQRKRIKTLERELQRKEAALAETAALLTLSKKARAIWGDGEDA